MAALEDQARFLVAKYGTAAGPTGIPAQTSATMPPVAIAMIAVGLLLFAVILYALLRDWQVQQQEKYSMNQQE